MKLPAPAFVANPATNSYMQQTLETDLMDLQAALRKEKVPAKQRESILEEYRDEREKIQQYTESLEKWQDPPWTLGGDEKPKEPKPELGEIKVPGGLPGEFADYFRGSIAFHGGRTNEARLIWEKLLERPKEERQFRSTWTAYMLGRVAGTEEDQLKYYKQVRELVKAGLRDSLGLATASLGWEAQVNLHQKNFERALQLYLEQYAGGDSTAVLSLRFAAMESLSGDPATLEALAKNPRTRKVITAFLISQAKPPRFENAVPAVNAWLAAVEAAGMRDVEAAEQLALAAYQNGEMELAQHWIDRSRNSTTAQWLQAKLLLRAGKIQKAAAVLSLVAQRLPVEQPGTNEAPQGTFPNSLYMNNPGNWPEERTAPSQVLAELGVLHLARREYLESLDALLRSGYWEDAAYVAERVLSVDELKGYVDSHWPLEEQEEQKTVDGKKEAEETMPWYEEITPQVQSERIRYLLARRLTRLSRGAEARAYFPKKIETSYEQLMTHLTSGYNESLPPDQRGRELFEAAKILRHQGMELIGTELAPDWHVDNGRNERGVDDETRRTNELAKVLVPSKDELNRYQRHKTDPDVRFHYRYQAAFIAWDGAKLMPNNSDETAKMLWSAGVWLKDRDPKTADIFYKALVKRCRKTALGEEADRTRWFPELDEAGNIIPGKDRRSKRVEEPMPSDNEAPNGITPALPPPEEILTPSPEATN
ncbi:hypothetical protein [Pedosphaera parvula]|uniref:Uncharacterized protein n=1 Tax=Pedosphaera parvula (strain Ellin514) TaxID=320771 RepID=B9XE81_PEDPL|nr:hypothetical protein [Pedosphaera parvula]EEF61972.1 hypothetical protein Cflav_PD4635 [Pedosphaera parvula Ellin514]